jgi:hypothetical protein
MAEQALYYPYIQIRDIEWVKATLLLFERIYRMGFRFTVPLLHRRLESVSACSPMRQRHIPTRSQAVVIALITI